ncbi:MAG: hypothetical protein ACR2FV_11395 [Ornithinimicrobium sp.]|uniref:hypothetical protein n=1 Tax=Ornithinimicrobium sp. TaxID=1977084 RepID=UPI0017D050D1|nr:hypothetical protein [Actinomycetota bacterium]
MPTSTPSAHGPLAVGVLLLEVGAAMTVYISAVVLPRAMVDLDAAGAYPVLLSAASVGAFLAFVVAQPLWRPVPRVDQRPAAGAPPVPSTSSSPPRRTSRWACA